MPSLANLMEDYRNWRGRQEWQDKKGWEEFYGGDSEMQERAERMMGGFGTGSHGVGGLAGTLIGEQGMARLGAGETLAKAKEMLANKVNPEEVWRQTLVMEHPTTDKLLMKIPSNKARYTGEEQKKTAQEYYENKLNQINEHLKKYPQDAGKGFDIEEARAKSGLEDLNAGYYSGTLDRFLDFPELYKAYPRSELMDISIEPNLDSAGVYRGYTTGRPEIAMQSNIASRLNSDFSPERVLSHELGHYVAHEEGLPMGGSPERASEQLRIQAQELENKHKPSVQEYKSLTNMLGDVFNAQYLNKLRGIAESSGNIAPRRINNISDFYRYSDEIRGQLGPMPSKAGAERNNWMKQAASILYEKAHAQIYSKQGDSLIEKLNKPSNQLRNEESRLMRKIDKMRPEMRQYDFNKSKFDRLGMMSDYQKYERIADEALARENERLWPMTEQELRENYPMKRGELGGVSLSDLFNIYPKSR